MLRNALTKDAVTGRLDSWIDDVKRRNRNENYQSKWEDEEEGRKQLMDTIIEAFAQGSGAFLQDT